MKKLIAVGDSFTWGNDLKDGNTIENPSNFTYAALTAQALDREYICTAVPGCGNGTIMRRCIEAVEKNINDDLLVTVMWTFPHRLEMITRIRSPILRSYDNFYPVSHWHQLNFEDKIAAFGVDMDAGRLKFYENEHKEFLRTGISDISKAITDYADQNFYFYETIKSMLLLKLYLEQHNINYFFFTACEKAELRNLITQDTQIRIFNYLAKRAKWIEAPSFYEWAKNNNYKIGGSMHPLEDAHKDYFETFIKSKVIGVF
jgi:hypothetical protein